MRSAWLCSRPPLSRTPFSNSSRCKSSANKDSSSESRSPRVLSRSALRSLTSYLLLQLPQLSRMHQTVPPFPPVHRSSLVVRARPLSRLPEILSTRLRPHLPLRARPSPPLVSSPTRFLRRRNYPQLRAPASHLSHLLRRVWCHSRDRIWEAPFFHRSWLTSLPRQRVHNLQTPPAPARLHR